MPSILQLRIVVSFYDPIVKFQNDNEAITPYLLL